MLVRGCGRAGDGLAEALAVDSAIGGDGPGDGLLSVTDHTGTFIHSGDLIAFEAGPGEFLGFDG